MRARRLHAALAFFALPAAVLVLTGHAIRDAQVAHADTATVRVDEQAYAIDYGLDPYQDSDLHIAVTGGQQTVHTLLHIDLSSLPSNVVATGLTITLTPNADAKANVAAQLARLQACVLMTALRTPADPTQPPPYNCGIAAATPTIDANGRWTFDVTTILRTWQRDGNTGLAIVANVPAPLVTPPAAPVTAPPIEPSSLPAPPAGPQPPVSPPAVTPAAQTPAPTWSIAFDHTATRATIVYRRAATSAGSAGLSVPPLVVAAPPPAVGAPALPAALAPAHPSAQARPAPAAAAAPEPAAGTAATPTVVEQSQLSLSNRWLGLALALTAAAVAVFAASTLWRVDRVRRFSPAVIGATLRLACSRRASTILVLGVAAAVAGGAAGQAGFVSVPRQSPQAGGADGVPTPTASGAAASGGVPAQGLGTPGSGTDSAASPSRGATASAPGKVAPTPATLSDAQVGIVLQGNTAQLADSLGYKGLDNGNEQSDAQAIVAWVNGHGGLHAHRLVPVYYTIDPSRVGQVTASEVQQEECTQFTEQANVIVGLDSHNGAGVDTFASCMTQHSTAVVENVAQYAGDAQTFASHPDYFTPAGIMLDREVAAYASELSGSGYLSNGAKIGLLSYDTPSYHRAADEFEAALERHGAHFIDQRFFPAQNGSSDFAAADSSASSYELAFRGEGIDHVVFLEPNADGLLFFTTRAQSQQYQPRYAVTSADGAQALVSGGEVPASQMEGATGIGWFPPFDVDAQHGGTPPPGRQRCIDIYKGAGITFTPYSVAEAAGLTICDELLFAKGAADLAAEPLTTATFAAGASRLGHSYAAAATFSERFDAAHRDGVALVRSLRFQGDCSCFAYAGGEIGVP